jgi:hypothetical protein
MGNLQSNWMGERETAPIRQETDFAATAWCSPQLQGFTGLSALQFQSVCLFDAQPGLLCT